MNEDTMVLDEGTAEETSTPRAKYDEDFRRRFRAFARRTAKKNESTWTKDEDDYILTDANGNQTRIDYQQWLLQDQDKASEVPVAEDTEDVDEDIEDNE